MSLNYRYYYVAQQYNYVGYSLQWHNDVAYVLNDIVMWCEHWGARQRPKCALNILTTPRSVQVRETRIFIDWVRVRRLFVVNSRHLDLAKIKTPKKSYKIHENPISSSRDDLMHLCLAGMMERILGAVMTYVLMWIGVHDYVCLASLWLLYVA